MSLVLEDTIQIVTPESVNDLGNQIVKIVNHLETLFKLEDRQIENKELLVLLLKLRNFAEKIISNLDWIRRIELIKEFKQYLSIFISKYSNFLPESFVKEIESVEMYSNAIIQLATSQLIMLSAALDNNDEVESLRRFYSGLFQTQQVVDKYIVYLPDNIIQAIKSLLEKILIIYQNFTSETLTSSEFKNLEKYVILTKNIAIATIWKINNYQTNLPKTFKNLDELWDYWDRVFDENEMEETSEALIQALNETREQQGKSKLFK
jgi:hypothetical protein